ncbi:MAG: hypothetical protein FJ211_10295 [Ignavibacteria bacterium]|nr:hypothetical protein [Ignavibacteria bacterium]
MKEVTLATVRTLSNALVDSKHDSVEANKFLAGRIDRVVCRLYPLEDAAQASREGIERIDKSLEETDEDARKLRERVLSIEKAMWALQDENKQLKDGVASLDSRVAAWFWQLRDMGKGAKASHLIRHPPTHE